MTIFVRIFVVIGLTIMCGINKAQPWINKTNSTSSASTFYDIQRSFNDYWKDKEIDTDECKNAEEGGWQQFKRWENFMIPRVFPTGNFFKPTALYDEWKKYKKTGLKYGHHQSRSSGNWSFIGPGTVPSNGGGAGRINCLRFHPTDTSIFWIGTASGGLWKTTDGGNSWSSNTDLLANLSVADIAINPLHPDTLYMATGDGYGYETTASTTAFWGGTYSAGVLKSTDGGLTWDTTGLSYVQTQQNIIQRLIVCPSNPEILLAAARDGIWRTTNGGANWINVKTEHIYDLEINTSDPATIYASSSNDIFVSTDTGVTWNTLANNLCNGTGRLSIAVTPANSSVIYAWCETGSFYKSSDGGTSFQSCTSPDDVSTFYGYYDHVLAVSPVDENTIYVGGLNVVQSTDGGTSWNILSDGNHESPNYVHPDNHDIEFLPGNGSTAFSCNDGGIFKTSDGGITWTNLSNGLQIAQLYRLSCSATNPGIIYTGAQDNGTCRYDSATWKQVFGADGMECIVDYTNSNNVYISYQYGAFLKSDDGGNTFTNISSNIGSGSGAWTTPYVMHPSNPQILYAGYNDVYKTTDGGLTWTNISNGSVGSVGLYSLAVASSDPDYIYAAELGSIYKTADGGLSWTNITSGLPIANAGISFIAVSNNNPETVWVTFSGYSNGEKVFKSTDAGATWTNSSGSLPNIPVNCIINQKNTAEEVYIGTDFGVYYSNDSLTDWVMYNTGLPNVIVDELEIQYGVGKLRAATYGRGVWETPLNSASHFIDAGVSEILSIPLISCDSSIAAPIIKIGNYGTDTITSATVQYQVDAGSVSSYSWTGTLPPFATAEITVPSISASPGTHTFNAFVFNPNNGTDINSGNDSIHFSFSVKGNGQSLPIVEGFENSTFPPTGWMIDNPDGDMTWQKYPAAGGFGNSSVSARIRLLYTTSGKNDYLYTDFMNFNSSGSSTVNLKFNVAYARIDDYSEDSLFVNVSDNCGFTWSTVWMKAASDLATAPDKPSGEFIPTASDWREEVIDLSSFANQSQIRIMFLLKGADGNDIYIDDINIGSPTSIAEKEFKGIVNIHPNPSAEEFMISIEAKEKSFLTIEVYNIWGQRIRQIKSDIINEKNLFKINLADQSEGFYFVRIETNKMTINRKMTLLK